MYDEYVKCFTLYFNLCLLLLCNMNYNVKLRLPDYINCRMLIILLHVIGNLYLLNYDLLTCVLKSTNDQIFTR